MLLKLSIMTTILIKTIGLFLINFYTLSFTGTNGNTINMSSYANKKIMIVNIATGSNKVSQLAGLRQLQTQFADSLQIIVFPSNSFGKEARTDAQIKQFVQAMAGNNIVIAAKCNVINANTNAVFSWLGSSIKNGDMNAVAGGDFEKFLINKDGTILGVYSSKVSPQDPSIAQAILSNF
jgi:glutathione peroxidase